MIFDPNPHMLPLFFNNLNNGFLSHGIQDDFGTNFDNFSEGNSQSAIFERNYRNFCRKHLKLREINSLFRLASEHPGLKAWDCKLGRASTRPNIVLKIPGP